jgi:hypothetical protein
VESYGSACGLRVQAWQSDGDLVEERKAGAAHSTVAAHFPFGPIGVEVAPAKAAFSFGPGLCDEYDTIRPHGEASTAQSPGQFGDRVLRYDPATNVDDDDIVARAAHLAESVTMSPNDTGQADMLAVDDLNLDAQEFEQLSKLGRFREREGHLDGRLQFGNDRLDVDDRLVEGRQPPLAFSGESMSLAHQIALAFGHDLGGKVIKQEIVEQLAELAVDASPALIDRGQIRGQLFPLRGHALPFGTECGPSHVRVFEKRFDGI